MAHLRKRFLSANLEEILGFSPLVGLLGHRQVGKTTLLEKHCKQYLSFDDEDLLANANRDIKEFLKNHKSLRTGLDESQLCPKLFPSLKEVVRKDKRPGQYLLSGSVRFTSRKAIQESLTGRIMNLELLPLTISELHNGALPETLIKLIKCQKLDQFPHQIESEIHPKRYFEKSLQNYFESGGLPGISFIRKQRLRSDKIKSHLETILDRDIRLVYPTTLPYSQILDYLKALAQREGQIIRYSDYESLVKISEATQKKLLYAFEAVFLLRLLPCRDGKKGHIVLLEDQAELQYLSERSKPSVSDFESLCYRNLRAQFFYTLGLDFRFFHFATRNGARVPFAVQTPDCILGFIPYRDKKPSRSQMASADSFLKTFDNSKVVYVSENGSPEIVSSRSLVLPLSLLA